MWRVVYKVDYVDIGCLLRCVFQWVRFLGVLRFLVECFVGHEGSLYGAILGVVV